MTQVRLAEVGDIEGIRALMKKYHRDTISDEDRPDGFVTTAITDGQLTELIEKERGVMIIAEPTGEGTGAGTDEGADKVFGFCFAAPWEFWTAWPMFRHMIGIIPDYEFDGKKLIVKESYQYGPVCVDRSIRGTGAFEDLFFASLEQFRDRYPVMLTFVNQINKRSENAHNNKAHMETLGTFRLRRQSFFSDGNTNRRCGQIPQKVKRLREDPRRPEIRNILIKYAIYLYTLSLQKAACVYLSSIVDTKNVF